MAPLTKSKIIFLLKFKLLALLVVACSSAQQHPGETIGIEAYPTAKDLYAFTEELRVKHDLPALGLGIIHNGKIVGLGMAGERRIRSNDWAAIDDLFDFASCMKSMTATVAGMSVEKGHLHWNSTLKEIFPELVTVMRPEYRDVTLEMLLSHRSGLNSWMGSSDTWTAWNNEYGDKSCTEQRYLFTKKVLQDAPRYKPGTSYHYCNDGYLVTASILEKITRVPWEKLIHQQLFNPLQLTSTYAGIPDTSLHETIAWGHQEELFSRLQSVNPQFETEHDAPAFGTGSGKLLTSVPDLLRYLDFHLQGGDSKGTLLRPETFAKLHTPIEGQNYALGWNVEVTYDTNGNSIERSIFHGGYNGRTRSNMWFNPDANYGTVIVYNFADGRAKDAYEDIFYALLRKYKVIN